jgi:hypothetical protein
MIMTQLDLPERQQSLLLVVFTSFNLERMAMGDPITLESVREGGLLKPFMYPNNVSLLIGYEPDEVELYRRANGDTLELLRWLERGRKFIKGVDGTENTFSMGKPKGD